MVMVNMVEKRCWGKTPRFLFSSASILLQQPIGHPSQSLQPSPSLHTISPPISISNFSSKCICPKYKMYFSKIQNVFVQIGKCICPNWKMYSSNLENCVMVKLFAGPPTAQWPQKASANTCHQIPSPFPSITPTPPTPLAPKPLPVSGPLIQKPAIKYHCRQEQ